MTVTLILVLLGLVALLFMVRIAKGRGSTMASTADLIGSIRPVDVNAFRNLIDPAEEEFLRTNLSPPEFRKVQRERLRAAMEYVLCAARNAAVLVRMGEAARRSPEPSIAEAGERLVDSAIRLRLYSFQAMLKLWLGILLPGAHISTGPVAERYERMTGLVVLLGRLQSPHRGASLAL
jgi:hypothetical protein